MCSTTAPEGASTEVPVGFRCHSCRVTVDLQKVTDYSSFVRSHNFSSSNQGSSTLFPSSLKALLGLNDEGDEDDEDSGSGMDIGLEACRTDHVIPPLRYGAAPSEGEQRCDIGVSACLTKEVGEQLEDWKAVEIMKKIRDQGTGDKVIVFSHFTALLNLIEVPIARSGWKYRRYDGRMTPAERGSAISSFASQPDCLVLLVSSRLEMQD
ncbi:hypothetical protein V6Z93_010392 [Aspergillus fumigatus]